MSCIYRHVQHGSLALPHLLDQDPLFGPNRWRVGMEGVAAADASAPRDCAAHGIRSRCWWHATLVFLVITSPLVVGE